MLDDILEKAYVTEEDDEMEDSTIIDIYTVEDEYGNEVEPAVVETISINVRKMAEELGYVKGDNAIPVSWIREYAKTCENTNDILNMVEDWLESHKVYDKYEKKSIVS